MGNILSDHYSKKFSSNQMNLALKSFIIKECPIYLDAFYSNDINLKKIILKQFNDNFKEIFFHDFNQILIFLEKLRTNQVRKLYQLTKNKFKFLPEIKFSCLPCKISNYLTLAFFDTGCSISCMTLNNVKKLNLILFINKNVNGEAIGFGCNREIVGYLKGIPVQLGEKVLVNVDFIVISKANADFILIGADFMYKHKIIIDYLNGKLIFPQKYLNEQKLNFIPNLNKDFDLFELKLIDNNISFLDTKNIKNFFCKNTNLYIQVIINGKQVSALIDSGADTSRISDSLAFQLGILQFIDYTNNKFAYGLGTVVSIGKIPPIPIQFYNETIIFISFEVIKQNQVNILLLGSDFFSHYGCKIDFKTKSIHIPLDPPCNFTLKEQKPKTQNNNEIKLLLK